MTTVFAFKFSDHEHFTNRYMSLGIFNQINQIIFVLETKKISMRFSCLCIVILCKHKTGDCKLAFIQRKMSNSYKINRNTECIP